MTFSHSENNVLMGVIMHFVGGRGGMIERGLLNSCIYENIFLLPMHFQQDNQEQDKGLERQFYNRLCLEQNSNQEDMHDFV